MQKTQKFFYNLLPAKKLALFAVLAVLVLGVSFALSKTSYAAFEMTAAQKTEFASIIRSNPAMSAQVTTQTDMDNLIAENERNYNSFADVKNYLTDNSTPDTTAASLNQFSPSALGGALGEWFASKVWNVVIGVLAILAYFCKVLLMFGGKAMDATLNENLYYFTNNPLVIGGWTIVRDVCNLFFLLALLFIAICTILKIEKYHAKKTLLTLIIMALLINFSKPIAIFIFDGSQLLMNMFLSEITKTGQGTPSAKLAGDIAQFIYSDLTTELNAQSGSMQIAVYYLFVVVFLFMFAVALFATAIFLVIRIVAVMVLIIVSPLAFLAAVIPDFSKMSSSWWSALFKYCYYGPAAAFFLFLATKFALGTAGSVLPHLNVQGETSNVIPHLILYLTVLVFLYASIIMSQQFGLFAANAIVGNANKFMKWAGGMTKTGGMWGWGARTSGATGAVSSRLQQSKYMRWMTKEGRKEAQEEREAWLGEKVGVKGAMERQVQKRAKKYKDEHYTEEALKAMAAKGDAAAAFLLAENGDMNNATYAALQGKRSYQGNVKKMVDKKLKKKQLHIFVDGQLDNFIAEQTAKGTTYANRDIARQTFADQKFGKLSPVDVKEQDIDELIKDPVFVQALRNAYLKNPKNQNKIVESMSANKYAAGQAAGVGW